MTKAIFTGIYRGSKLSPVEIIGFREYFPARLTFYAMNPPVTRNRVNGRKDARQEQFTLEWTPIRRAMYQLPAAVILAATGLGLAFYATYLNKALASYFAVLGTVVFMGGLLLLALWQFRPGTSSSSCR
ncbi:MAG TPA: hypothetical protein VGS11_07310 [Candidatus Bathyarchaeia archaeon]|nr:hypothetical protein [Candidatus Bathyarchaeia archaeon]